ncbi:MAG: Rap1a/Tai family immunity protein [Kiloniellaceae bacterium]
MIGKKFLAMVVIAVPLTSVSAQAQPDTQSLTGEEWLAACTIADPEWIGFCHGYVQAVFDGFRRPDEEFCVPQNVTKAQIVEDAIAVLINMPETRELRAYSLVYAVLMRKYPC